MEVALEDALWIVIVSFIVAFVLAFAIGANDVANSFGTSVGAKVLTLRQACILGSIFETLGAILVGSKVSDTIRKGVIDPTIYNGSEAELMLGELSALGASSAWLFIATGFSLPVSGSHSIIGATLGFSLVARGSQGVQWRELVKIVISWFVSPLLSGMLSSALFWGVRKYILNTSKTLDRGLLAMPLFYGVTMAINLFSVFYDGSELLGFHKIPLYGAIILAVGIGIICGTIVWIFVRPYLRKKISESMSLSQSSSPSSMVASDSSATLVLNIQGMTPGATPAATPGQTPVATPRQTPKHTPSSSPSGSPKSKRKQLPTIHETDLSHLEEELQKELTERKKEAERLERDCSGNKVTFTSDSATNTPMAERKFDVSVNQNGTDEVYGMQVLSLSNSVNTSYSELNAKESYAEASNKYVKLKKDKKSGKKRGLETATQTANAEITNMDIERSVEAVKDKPEAVGIFSSLQILTAIFGSFAHGGNDVSNCIGPVIAVFMIWQEGSVSQQSSSPIWILLYGGVGISIGLWVLGQRVIKTMGEDITAITPSSGFCVEIGAATTVLAASNLGIPVSTTHCKVGSVVSVGWLRSRAAVDWNLFRNIILAWLVTVPCSGAISAGLMAFFLFGIP